MSYLLFRVSEWKNWVLRGSTAIFAGIGLMAFVVIVVLLAIITWHEMPSNSYSTDLQLERMLVWASWFLGILGVSVCFFLFPLYHIFRRKCWIDTTLSTLYAFREEKQLFPFASLLFKVYRNLPAEIEISQRQFEKLLRYLAGRGYVEEVNMPSRGFHYQITRAGIDREERRQNREHRSSLNNERSAA